MQAAVTLARAGVEVELLEQKDELGGLLPIASLPPHKQRLAELVEYLKTEVNAAQVNVHLSTTFEPAMLAEYNPDLLVLAWAPNQSCQPSPGQTIKSCPWRAYYPGMYD